MKELIWIPTRTDSKEKKNMRQLGNWNDWVSEDTDFTRYGYGTYSDSFKKNPYLLKIHIKIFMEDMK